MTKLEMLRYARKGIAAEMDRETVTCANWHKSTSGAKAPLY
jgi:hypothetical protein